jgi:acyl dehydratase
MDFSISKFSIRDLYEGQVFSFSTLICEDDVNKFANLSGDVNPLHMIDEFAVNRGFSRRVVHGVLLSSYVSRLVGIHLPGENALIHSINLRFMLPAYINDTIKVEAVVDQISIITNTIVLSVGIRNVNTQSLLVKGNVQVGFTENINKQ